MLLTGFVQKPEDKRSWRPRSPTWQPSCVREVKNEIKIGRSLDFADYSEDASAHSAPAPEADGRPPGPGQQFQHRLHPLDGLSDRCCQDRDGARQRVIDHARDIAYVRGNRRAM